MSMFRSKLSQLLAAGLFSAVLGVDLVGDLVRKAQKDSHLTKRDAEFNVSPLITSVTPERLNELTQKAAALDPTYVPVDFTTWYQVLFTEPTSEQGILSQDVSDLLSTLAGYDEVTSCQPLISARPPAVNPSNDPEFTEQTYLMAAPVGIDVQYAWGFPGGDGANTTIIDIERGWKLNHEDLQAANVTLVGRGLNSKDRLGGNWWHGTSVLGEMLMVDNSLGGVGAIPAAKGHVVGITRVDPATGGPYESNPEAIIDATNALGFGDAMLLEMQVLDANDQYWPVEIYDAEYDAIRLATALGITVVEPAGNGNQDLDTAVTRPGGSPPVALLNPSSPDFRDSGAIMVGASTKAIPRTKVPASNYGSRIDVHSWGELIHTSQVDGPFGDDDSYGEFDGTSGASPIVVGAALSIQGMISVNRGTKLDAFALRSLIKIGGTATSNPSVDRIGVQPNLRALIDGGHLAILSALAGSYELLNITTIRVNDSVEVPNGRDPYLFTGLLVYTSTGYMSATMTSFVASDLPENGTQLTWPPQNTTEFDETWAAVGKTTLAYAGELSINPDFPATRESGSIIHGTLHVTNIPSWGGTLQRRDDKIFKMRGLVFLRLTGRVGQEPTQGALWWKKLD
ncbi:peptidase S8/S53 domain-containing protein [Podospora australis]|uniref:Peptidase S8/S53 domain-containing protein n=1 Tax=Podospora australis TaxID=1536484 RepID=A0AAN7AGP4_9PEZI|nr:peptidase S8/S53 domain-containing protein [Podospora australis]